MSRTKVVGVVCLCIALISSGLAASGCARSAQPKYPTKAMELIVPWPPGGGVDVAFRALAPHLSKELGQPVNVVNKPGGNQVIGVQEVLNSKPDGYTLLGDSGGSSSIQVLIKDLPYDIMARTYVARAMVTPHAFFCNSKLPWQSLRDVAEAAKANPESFTWAGLGGTSVTDLSQLQFFVAAGIPVNKIKKVSFQGSGPGLQAVGGGHVQFGNGGVPGVKSFMGSGTIRVLAVTGDKRVKALPDVPSAAEAGFPQVTLCLWMGISGPAGLPDYVVQKWNAVLKKILADPEVIKDLEKVGAEPYYLGPEEYRKFVQSEMEEIRKIAAELGQ